LKPAAFPLLFLAATAGCTAAAGLADPPLAQLARWRNAAPEAVATEPVAVPCPAANPACPRLHALRAEACLGQALALRAPGAACPPSRAATLLDCATGSYAAALAARFSAATGAPAPAASFPGTPALAAMPLAGAGDAASADAPALHAGLAQALLCRAELDEPATAATRAAAAAEAAKGAPPDLAALHGARAALSLARVGPSPLRCAAARRALGLSAAAPPEHRARLGADALLHLRTCDGPAR
jgi:hypothetical protein